MGVEIVIYDKPIIDDWPVFYDEGIIYINDLRNLSFERIALRMNHEMVHYYLEVRIDEITSYYNYNKGVK